MSPERDAFPSILVLPWLAHGHISPFLELSKRFAVRNIHIYFCSTPVNLASIKPKLAGTKYFSKIKLVELHLPSLSELPPRNHTTKTLPPHLMPTLKKAFDMSSPGFADILRLLDPDLVVYDFLQPWAPVVASSLGIPAVEFLCTSGTMCAFVNHANMKPGVEFPYPGIYLCDHEVDKFTNLLEYSANGIKDRERMFQCYERSLDMIMIMIKSIREIEGKYIDYLSFLIDKRVVPVGPLVEDTMSEDAEKSEILDWLDNKEEKSTVFVSFGSEYFLSRQEMTEIAHGLEASKVNFVWVVRFHDGERHGGKRQIPLARRFPQESRGKRPGSRRVGTTSGDTTTLNCRRVREPLRMELGDGEHELRGPDHRDADAPGPARECEGGGGGGRRCGGEEGREGAIRRAEVARSIRNVMVDKVGGRARRRAREMRGIMRRKGDEEVDGAVEELLQVCRKRNWGEEDHRILLPN